MHDATTHDDSKGQYFWVWGALLLLTAVEVWLGYKQVFQPVAMLEVLLGLSVVKSALIIAYFMYHKVKKALLSWPLMISVVGFLGNIYLYFRTHAGRIHLLGLK